MIKSFQKQITAQVLALWLITIGAAGCGTLTGATVGGAAGAGIGAATHSNVGRSAAIGAGVGGALGAAYDIYDYSRRDNRYRSADGYRD